MAETFYLYDIQPVAGIDQWEPVAVVDSTPDAEQLVEQLAADHPEIPGYCIGPAADDEYRETPEQPARGWQFIAA